MTDTIAFIIGGATAAGLLAIGHWAPLPGKNGKLPTTVRNLLVRYVYGTISLWAGAMVWMLLSGRGWWVALVLMAINAIGGITVGLVYFWDEIVQAFNQRNVIQRTDEELSE